MNVVEREFNALAADYELNRLAPWYRAQADLILNACEPLAAGDVLDVGCGTGYLLRSYLARSPGARGVGIDIAGAMVEQAAALAAADGVNNVKFIKADWETLEPGELDEFEFRLAFCTSAFHYFSAPQQAAEKLCRMLDTGGTLYLIERNKSNSPLTLLWGWLHRHWIKDNVEFYSLAEVVDCFRTAGFADVAVVRTVNRLLWKNKLYTSVALIKCTK
ncbi:MAG TPA: class I SAM-dependent methyltransferase [Arenicellales bacterium]|nr:class I SAM-dependent methyltransferase [Arenicellales bacterium]